MLKIKTKKAIDCFDFDKAVTEYYGRPYCFQQQDGCKGRGVEHFSVPSDYADDEYMNDSIPFRVNGSEQGVKFEVWKNADIEEINSEFNEDYESRLFWHRNFYPSFDVLLNDMYNEGLIEEGEYTMEIDW